VTSVGVDGATARLAEHWATAPAAAFPLAAMERARLCLRDTIGVILGALALPEGRQIEQYVVEELGGPAQASIVGSVARVGRRHAAFANGWLADMLDYEDGYLYGGTHPSAAIIPAVLALAQEERLDGSAVLRAIVAGYDVANRIARAIHPEHQNRGFAAAGTVGALGAAAAAKALDTFEQVADVEASLAALAPLAGAAGSPDGN